VRFAPGGLQYHSYPYSVVQAFAIGGHKLFKPAVGARLAVMCLLRLWGFPLAQRCVNASYDYLLLLVARGVINPVMMQPHNVNLRMQS